VDRKWVTLSNTTIGTFMALLDSSIVLVSLPTIGRELPGAGPGELLWTVLSYNVVTTTLLLSFGRLSDMFGRVRLYTLGFAIFTVGSGLAGFSGTGAELLAARIFQGIGAGFLTSNSAAILTDSFPRSERGRALGMNQVAALTGSMIGLVLGGVLTTTFGWRSIFFVNLPIGAVGTLWAYTSLRETHRETGPRHIDWAGNIAFALGLTLTLVGVTLGALQGWTTPTVLFTLLAGPLLLLAFVWIEGIVPSPMFDLALFRIRTFVAGNLSALLAALARGAFLFVMVFYFQGVLGDTAEYAGLLLLPLPASFAIAGPISGALSDRTGARYLGTAGLVLSALGFLVLAVSPAYSDYTVLAFAMVLLGVGQGMFAAPNRAEVMSSVPPDRRGIAAGTGVTFLNGGNLGSLAVGFTILAAVLPRSSLGLVFTGANPGVPADLGGFVRALHLLFAIGLALTLAAALVNAARGSTAPPRTDIGRGPPTIRHPTYGLPVASGEPPTAAEPAVWVRPGSGS
jgi:EmrB/QacA subfamily drug resistance transporter